MMTSETETETIAKDISADVEAAERGTICILFFKPVFCFQPNEYSHESLIYQFRFISDVE